ncbi:MAG: putative toxin-antitoxin system toxin component, PIN family [Coriobacteriales bacterium]|jgi:putative PIN family toxin of toxin-antitoxin system|nr:putative toxin-antitoxin system toxin component, PIN family [Coriobacteriales bacterium]
MRRVVIDTNVLVSALLNPDGTPARVLSLFLNGKVEACYDSRILHEYKEVLARPKFPFEQVDIDALVNTFERDGFVIAPEHTDHTFSDDADRKFYEVATTAEAVLITGNKKHFPSEARVLSPLEFLSG